jgi:regulation of enolase protein 1 (concanavalin A-like superfamily)
MVNVSIDALPELSWTAEAAEAGYADEVLTLACAAGTDWIVDSLDGSRQDSATALVFDAPAEFALTARATVPQPRTTYDAGVLCLWASPDYWAKLCFEFSPQGSPGVVSVVTNVFSDDCNSVEVDGDSVFLRITRAGGGWVFHSSVDGERWSFVRQFRLATDLPVRVGFLAQSPMGGARTVQFDSIRLAPTGPSNLRDGT